MTCSLFPGQPRGAHEREHAGVTARHHHAVPAVAVPVAVACHNIARACSPVGHVCTLAAPGGKHAEIILLLLELRLEPQATASAGSSQIKSNRILQPGCMHVRPGIRMIQSHGFELQIELRLLMLNEHHISRRTVQPHVIRCVVCPCPRGHVRLL